jgi:hypothetical protein
MIHQKNKSLIWPLCILVLSALVIRILAFHNTLMMNNDGTIYIHQARALYYGLWPAINSCSSVDYLTLYAILIAAIYPVFGDWVRGAMAVNLIFGTLMIIPLYLLLRRFLDEKTSFLTTFIFVMLPLFVIQSVNIIRDPSFWFFSILGLYLLVYNDESKTPYALIFSSLSFIAATATRIEGSVFIMGGCLYAGMVFKQQRFKAAVLFLVPIILAISCFVLIQFIRHPANFYWYRFQEIPLAITNVFEQYHHLEQSITSLIINLQYGDLKEFLEHSRTIIWFVPLGIILNSALEALFYIFFFLMLFGFSGLKKRMQKDRRILPLLMIAAISLVVLYLYCLNIWSMENRRLAMVIIPTAYIMGFGAENLMRWLHKRFGLSDSKSVGLLCLLVLVLTLPKDLKIQEADKLVYKDIGETIARFDGGSGEIALITLGDSGRWINYYANLHVNGAPCPEKNGHWQNIIGGSYENFIRDMRMRKIHYVIWEENHWPRNAFVFLKSVQSDDLKQLREWRHRDTGRIIFYQVLYQKNS